MAERLTLREKVLLALRQRYEEQSNLLIESGSCNTVIERRKVIPLRNQRFVENLRGIFGDFENIMIQGVNQNLQSLCLRKVLYKYFELNGRNLKKNFRFNGFRDGSTLYVATTVGNRTVTTTQDILKKIEKSFTLERLGELRAEMDITFNLNIMYLNIYHFVIVRGNRIMIGDPFSFMSDKVMLRRNYLNRKLESFNNGEESDIFYYYQIFYNEELENFNNEFIFPLTFYSQSGVEAEFEEAEFEEAE